MAFSRRISTLLALGLMAVGSLGAQAQAQEQASAEKWTVVCTTAQDDCKATLKLPIDVGGELEIWVGTAGGKEYVGVLAPLGIHIPSGVAVSFDRGKTAFAKLNLVECKAIGCRAVIAMTPEFEASMRLLNEIAIILKNSDTRETTGLLVTLKGFAAALDDLRTR